jgi:hypothetical protein
MKNINKFLAVFLFSVFVFGVSAVAEEITLTTYYPAPYGNYEELQASKFAVGSAVTMPATDGDITAGGTIRANTNFNFNGTNGYSGTYTVVTDMRITGSMLQKRTRTITVSGGIITDTGTEVWTDVGSVNP